MNEEQKQRIVDAAIEWAKPMMLWNPIDGHWTDAVKNLINAVKAAQEPEFIEGEVVIDNDTGRIYMWNVNFTVELYRRPTLADLQKMHPTGYVRRLPDTDAEYGFNDYFCIPLPEDSSDE